MAKLNSLILWAKENNPVVTNESLKLKTKLNSGMNIIPYPGVRKVQEDFKSVTPAEKVTFPKELGIKNENNMDMLESLYRKEGIVTGIIQKYIDFVLGSGCYVTSKDDNAKKIIEEAMESLNFDNILRNWLKEALVKGTGYLELSFNPVSKTIDDIKVLNAKYMYIDMDEFGTIKGYNQYVGQITNAWYTSKKYNDVISFEPNEIACLTINKIGDSPYGLGIVQSMLSYVDDFGMMRKNLHMLMDRKANTPIHMKLGANRGGTGPDIIPSDDDVASASKELEYLKNRHEWATGPFVDFKTIDFGDIGEKFRFVLENDKEMIYAAAQIPGSLLGNPEGSNKAIADTVFKAFKQGRICSIQAEMERVIEEQIFRPILESNGIFEHVEFEWGIADDAEKFERIKLLTEALKIPMLSLNAIKLLEKDLIVTLDLAVEELETPEEERQREVTAPQPILPGANRKEDWEENIINAGYMGKIYQGELVEEVESG